MNTLRRGVLGVAALVLIAGSPAPVAAETAMGNRPLSFVEFSALPDNHGAPLRLIQRKYEEYRSGRVARTTLDVSRLR
ncbi:MAG: hypothetical protein HYT89_01595 [Candidatus Omnitrophica bacterium]|nr:hypothetical protein [Candidatus Omnitrophota bacterium]